MAEIRWTVVTRKNGRGQFQQTGFEGDWHEATAEGNRLYAADDSLEVWTATTADDSILVDTTDGKGRRVTIAPTKAQRAAAKAEAARIAGIADDLLGSWLVEYGRLQGEARALLGVEVEGNRAAAFALAEAGWTVASLSRRLS